MTAAPRVLITGARAPAALDLARHFHRAGWRVFLADSCVAPLAHASCVVQRAYRVPPPRTDRAGFIAALARIIDAQRITLLLPTCEEVFYIAQALPTLAAHCRVFTDEFPKMAQLHNKWTFARLTAPFAITAPETHLIETPQALAPWRTRSQDWVFKPVFSRFGAHVLIQPDPQALETIRPTHQAPWIAQRYVPGAEYSSYSVAQRGALWAHVTYQCRYRSGQGAGVHFASVEEPSVQAAIRAFTAAFVQALDYTGQIAFDFRMTSQGTLSVLECNPRATSGVHLFAASDALARAFEANATGLIQPRQAARKMLSLVAPLYAWQSGRPFHQILGDLLRTPDAVFSWHDPAPFFYQGVSFGALLLKSRRARLPLIQAATADLQWDGD